MFVKALDTIMLIGVAAFLFFGGRVLMHEVTSASLIYAVDDLPPFRETQDYSITPYSAFVRLESKDHPKAQGDFFCSGTVISDDYVLTAAHCVMEYDMIDIPSMRTAVTIVSSKNPDSTQAQLKVEAIPAAANTRADYALIKGDFRKFTKLRINHTPTMLSSLVGPIVACGFPWGAVLTCYATGNQFRISYGHFAMAGLLYPGMSGGPVVNIGTATVVAVNMAVAEGFVVVSPLVGLFETLGVKVLTE